MSHRFESHNTEFHFNSDGSGTCKIRIIDEKATDPWETPRIEVPVEALIEFVAHLVQTAKISALEDASPRQILGLPEDR